jgi:hypothetical protein
MNIGPRSRAYVRAQRVASGKGGDHIVMPLTPGAQIDELTRLLRESEQRRQVAEVKLADCDRRLGTARQTIATQRDRIGGLTAEVARLRSAAVSID